MFEQDLIEMLSVGLARPASDGSHMIRALDTIVYCLSNHNAWLQDRVWWRKGRQKISANTPRI